MENKIELFVSGPSSGTTIGQVDLFGNEPITLIYSIIDIKDINKRNSSYSQAFTVPANKNNNTLFNHIFNIGGDSSFDASKKTPSYLLVDSQQVFTGSLQLIKIKVKDKNPISYDIVIYGEAVDLVKTLGDKLLTDDDYSELTHISNTSNIVKSWTANTSTYGYYYPLIDYGYDFDLASLNPGVPNVIYDSGSVTSCNSNSLRDNTKNWGGNLYDNYDVNILTGTGAGQIRKIISNTDKVLSLLTDWTIIPDASSTYSITLLDIYYYALPSDGLKPSLFRPATSNKYLLDKIFRNAGFSYDSTFLNSDVFTQTIIPYNGPAVLTLSSNTTDYLRFTVSTYSDSTGINVFTPNFNVNDYNPNGYYNNITKRYTCPVNAGMTIGFNTTYSYSGTPNNYFNDIVVKFYRTGYFGGSYPFYEEQVRTDPNTFVNVKYNISVQTPELINATSGLFFPAAVGEQFWVKAQFNPYDPAVGLIYHAYNPSQPQYFGTSFYNIPSKASVDGGIIDYNSVIPKKVKQIDYIKSIITMFQLMVVPTKDNPKRVLIEPRQNYFANGQIKDWTSKLDLTESIEETLISEQQAKQVIFNYRPDKDYLNQYYTDDTKKVYGEYTQTIDNEWLDANSKQNISIIFSPTPMENVTNVEEIIIPKIGKLESGVFGRTDSNIRFLRKNQNLMQTNGPTIKMQGFSAQTSYPYAGHLDHPFESTIDYNFGVIDYAFYNTPNFNNLQSITPNNLVEVYWKDYLDYISDKNSKIIKCKIKLSPADMAQFNYNDKIYLEGLTSDGGHYFTVNKITYIPTSNESSLVELTKLNKI